MVQNLQPKGREFESTCVLFSSLEPKAQGESSSGVRHPSSVVHKLFLLTIFLPEPLVQTYNFTRMLPMLPSFKIA